MDCKERKRLHYFELQAQIDKHCTCREQYWSPIIAKELRLIPSIAWYIQAELIRTKQLPTGTTIRDINSVHCELRDSILRESFSVFNAIYRPKNKERFTVLDVPNDQLRERLGCIHSYDPARQSYLCYLDTNNGSGREHGQACYLKPRYLQPLYPKRPRRESATPQSFRATFQNPDPMTNEQTLSVVFRKQLFEVITRQWKHPETMGNASYDFLDGSMKHIETFEEAAQAKRDERTVNFQKRLDQLVARSNRLRAKRQRVYQNRPSDSAAEQIRAVQSVEYERLAIKLKRAELQNCHMFTMPFATTDESIHDAGQGLNEFDHAYNTTEPDGNDQHHAEFNILTSMGTSPRVVNANSVDLLKPHGDHMDNCAVDLCLKWCDSLKKCAFSINVRISPNPYCS